MWWTKPGESLRILLLLVERTKENWLEEKTKEAGLGSCYSNIPRYMYEALGTVWFQPHLMPPGSSSALLPPTGSAVKPHVVPRWLEPFQASYPHMSTAGGEQTKLPLQMSQHIIQVPRDLPHWELTTMAKGMGESEWLNPPNQMTGKGKRRKGGFSRGL